MATPFYGYALTSGTGENVIVAAPGADYHLHINNLTIYASAAANIIVKDGASGSSALLFSPAAAGTWTFTFPEYGLRLTKNKALVTTASAGVLNVTAVGYIDTI